MTRWIGTLIVIGVVIGALALSALVWEARYKVCRLTNTSPIVCALSAGTR